MDLFLIYLICFGTGLCFTLVSAFTTHVFGGHEAHVDLGHADPAGAHGHAEGGLSTSDMPGFAALSPTTIAAFITAFGGFGMIFAKIEILSSPWISLSLARTLRNVLVGPLANSDLGNLPWRGHSR